MTGPAQQQAPVGPPAGADRAPSRRRRRGGPFVALALALASAYVGIDTVAGPATVSAIVPAGTSLTVHVPAAVGGKTVFGNLAVDQVISGGFVTAYPCASGVPKDGNGNISRADLNYSGEITPVWSNRLIAQADAAGNVCFYTITTAHLIIDINGVTDTGITPI
ncbi:MAG: hypothetical protein HKN44_08590, partial [Ilumatobacter sp.]|nr:hypothetical protein [Ilumatobacter sp.]